jgi:hypothetical protein
MRQYKIPSSSCYRYLRLKYGAVIIFDFTPTLRQHRLAGSYTYVACTLLVSVMTYKVCNDVKTGNLVVELSNDRYRSFSPFPVPRTSHFCSLFKVCVEVADFDSRVLRIHALSKSEDTLKQSLYRLWFFVAVMSRTLFSIIEMLASRRASAGSRQSKQKTRS